MLLILRAAGSFVQKERKRCWENRRISYLRKEVNRFAGKHLQSTLGAMTSTPTIRIAAAMGLLVVGVG